MITVLDFVFYFFHIFIVVLNLFGWIPRATRRLHRWCVGITATCWLAIGAAYNFIGYCPLTDWHWQIKRARGETGLPDSFITYLCNQIGFYPNPAHVDIAVGITFAAIVIVTIVLWRKEKKSRLSSYAKASEDRSPG